MNYRNARVADYYQQMRPLYDAYSQRSLAWHVGLCVDGERNGPAALQRSNEILVKGLPLTRGMRALDAGCGIGGLAFFLAERFGLEVDGISIAPANLVAARRIARERGLATQVSFLDHDFMRLDSLPKTYQLVLNQESICYTSNYRTYLEGVRDRLVPGGWFRCVDGFLGPVELDPRHCALHAQIQVGWRIPPLRRASDYLEVLDAVGFQDLVHEDLSPMARATAEGFQEAAKYADEDLRRDFLGLADMAMFRQHLDACGAYGECLLDGSMRYALIGGRWPGPR